MIQAFGIDGMGVQQVPALVEVEVVAEVEVEGEAGVCGGTVVRKRPDRCCSPCPATQEVLAYPECSRQNPDER